MKKADHKKTLTTYLSYELTDLSALEEYFTEMAAKGWRLTSLESGQTFEACEPCTLRYSVQLLPTAESSDISINEKSRGYVDLCTDAGWKLVCFEGKLFVFVTDDPDVPDIVTDSQEKIDAVRKEVKRRFLSPLTISALICFAGIIFRMIDCWIHWDAETGFGSSTLEFTILFAVLVLYIHVTLFFMIKQVHAIRWVHHAERALAKGERIPYYGWHDLLRRSRCYLIERIVFMVLFVALAVFFLVLDYPVISLIMIGILALLVIVMWVDRILYRKSYTRRTLALSFIGLGILMVAIIGIAVAGILLLL